MSIKDILVYIDSGKSGIACLKAAIQLAQKYDAHLTGVFIIPPIPMLIYADGYIPTELIEAQEQAAIAEAEKAEGHFLATLDNTSCSGEWHCVKGQTYHQINGYARYTDLVIIGQAEGHGFISADTGIGDSVVLGCAKPVLFVPYIGVHGVIGKRIMVAWNGSRESVRATSDALPLLQQADLVDVVAVNSSSTRNAISTNDICSHLVRHGVKAKGIEVVAKDISVGDLLLARAADHSFDLMVMGAYGHTRLRETILGGVTKHFLEHMTIPILMSH